MFSAKCDLETLARVAQLESVNLEKERLQKQINLAEDQIATSKNLIQFQDMTICTRRSNIRKLEQRLDAAVEKAHQAMERVFDCEKALEGPRQELETVEEKMQANWEQLKSLERKVEVLRRQSEMLKTPSSLEPREVPSGKKPRIAYETPKEPQKVDFSVLQDFFPIGTPVLHAGRATTIEGYDDEDDEVIVDSGEGEGYVFVVPATELKYLPAKGDFCLIRETEDVDAFQRYYKIQIHQVVKPGNSNDEVKVRFKWVDFDQKEIITRRFADLDLLSMIPLASRNDPKLNELKQDNDVADLVPGQKEVKMGTGYYLQRRS